MRLFMALFVLMWASNSSATPPQPAPLKPVVTTLNEVQERQVSSGKARIKMLAHGKQAFVGQLWLAAGAQVPVHRDESEEYLYVISGQGEITINGQTSSIGPGAVIFMPSGAEVSYRNGSAPLVALQVFAGPESASKYDGWAPSLPAKKTP